MANALNLLLINTLKTNKRRFLNYDFTLSFANLKLAKELYSSAKPKLKGDQGMIDTFQNVFGLPESSVKLAGTVEVLYALFIFASFLNKNLSRLGSIATFGVLGVLCLQTL